MPRKRLILETLFCGSLSMLDILTDDGIQLKPVHILRRFGGVFKRQQYSSFLNTSLRVCAIRLTMKQVAAHTESAECLWCCQPARGHTGVLKSFSAPPLKAYSPCHLPLVIIKENIVIVSTFGTVSAQRRSLSSRHSYMPTRLYKLLAENMPSL